MAKKNRDVINLEEIKKQVSNLRKELLNLRFQKSSGQLQNTSQIKKNRRKIAHLLTKKTNVKGKLNA